MAPTTEEIEANLAEIEMNKLLDEDDKLSSPAKYSMKGDSTYVPINKLQKSGINDDEDSTLEDLEETQGFPVRETAAVTKIHPAPIICIWIALSSSVIVMNSWILNENQLDFPYPVFLTTCHLVYATIGTRVLQRTTNLLDGVANVEMSWDTWSKTIVPIGALFSGSLIFSNLAYLSLTLSFIQMLKAFTAVAVLIMSCVMGLTTFDQRTAIIVCAISFGVALASYGELAFNLGGFIFQCLGIMFEATRLVAIQKLLQGSRMDPLVSLYYFAPVCATLNMMLIPIFEGRAPFDEVMSRVGPVTLFINANVAFLLNVAVVFLIGCASSLVLTLSGVIKDILLVVGGMVLFGSPVSGMQAFGYSIALLGLVFFKTPQDVMAGYVARAKSMIGR